MIITRQDLNVALEGIRARVRDPASGIHGPGSMAWTLSRETIVFLGGGAAALLQLAHPYVAHAIDQHSTARTDMLSRFRRTFSHVFAMSFGDLDQARRAARRVHAIHGRIRGEIGEDAGRFRRGHRYHANDAEALLWVYATLVHTATRVIDLVVRPLGAGERERYLQDSKRFARLFGVPDALLPDDWPAFVRYMQRMLASDTIFVGMTARELGHILMQPPHPLLMPLWRWYRVMTAGLLPARLRAAFGLDMGPGERALFAASIRALRLLWQCLPPSLRYVPAYIQAERRLQGRAPSRTSALIERIMLHGISAPRTSAARHSALARFMARVRGQSR